jgi:hypothetical protein
VKCMTTIRAMRGIQWCKNQIRVLEGGWVYGKFFFFSEKMIGMIEIRVKRGIQWDRSQIMVETLYE